MHDILAFRLYMLCVQLQLNFEQHAIAWQSGNCIYPGSGEMINKLPQVLILFFSCSKIVLLSACNMILWVLKAAVRIKYLIKLHWVPLLLWCRCKEVYCGTGSSVYQFIKISAIATILGTPKNICSPIFWLPNKADQWIQFGSSIAAICVKSLLHWLKVSELKSVDNYALADNRYVKH